MAKIYRGIQIKLNHKAVSLRKCPYDHWLTDKAYLSAITVTNIYQSFTYKMAAEINWHNYGAKLRHCHPVCTSRVGCGPSGPCNDGDHFVEIFLQNCSLSIALTSADQKPQKSLKRWQAYYSSIITLPECQRDKLWQISQTFGGRERGVDSARRGGVENAISHWQGQSRYDTRCYINVRSKANMSQLNIPHGTDN